MHYMKKIKKEKEKQIVILEYLVDFGNKFNRIFNL